MNLLYTCISRVDFLRTLWGSFIKGNSRARCKLRFSFRGFRATGVGGVLCSLVEEQPALSGSSEKFQGKRPRPRSESGRQVRPHSCQRGEGLAEAAGVLGGYLAGLLHRVPEKGRDLSEVPQPGHHRLPCGCPVSSLRAVPGQGGRSWGAGVAEECPLGLNVMRSRFQASVLVFLIRLHEFCLFLF